jgi:serine/threonine protein kinase
MDDLRRKDEQFLCPYCRENHVADLKSHKFHYILRSLGSTEMKAIQKKFHLNFSDENDRRDKALLFAAIGASHEEFSAVIKDMKGKNDINKDELLVCLAEAVCLARMNNHKDLARSIGCCIAHLIYCNQVSLESGKEDFDLIESTRRIHCFRVERVYTQRTELFLINRNYGETPPNVNSYLIDLLFADFEYPLNPMAIKLPEIDEADMKNVDNGKKLPVTFGDDEKIDVWIKAVNVEESTVRFLKERSLYTGYELENEAKLCYRMSSEHPICLNLVRFFFPKDELLYIQKENGDRMFYVPMEFCEESNLRDYGNISDFRSALEALLQIALALRCLHDYGIVHRDVASRNVFLRKLPGGTLVYKVGDFGVAVFTSGSERVASSSFAVSKDNDQTEFDVILGEAGHYLEEEHYELESRGKPMYDKMRCDKILDVKSFRKMLEDKVFKFETEAAKKLKSLLLMQNDFHAIVQVLQDGLKKSGSKVESLKFLSVSGVSEAFKPEPICPCCKVEF